jgi:adenylate cyclase
VVPVGTWERIAYAGPSQTFLTVSSNALAYAADDAEAGPRNPLRGKVVLIGPTFSQSGDRFRTPKGEMPGVEVQANIVHTLLIRNWETLTTWVLGFGAQSLVSVGGAALFASLHPVEAGLVALIAVAGGFVPLAYAVHGSGDYWVDLAIPLLVVFVGVRAIDRREQRRLQLSFARYVSPEVVTQVLRSRDTTLRAEQREVSILFCDLRGSTALGEKLSMDELVRLMNNYFEMVTQAVFRHGGMINKFIGDGILAVYNAPVDVPHHADAAVKTALEIHAEMAQLNQRWGDWLAARLAVGVGIHSGRVISGNVGSALRLEYTIIGDPVNVASRVEAMTKELGARILITDATRSRLAEYYPLRSLGAVPIRGRAEPIELFEIT